MRSRAFTLLETLLAVTLMAVVAAAAYGLLHGGMTARRVVNQGAVEGRSLALALDQVARCVESATGPRGVLAGEFTGDDLADGVHDVLTFHCVLDALGSEWGDVRRVRFFVEPDDSGSPCLYRGLTSNLLSTTTAAEDVQVLCRDVAGFDVEYFDGQDWLESWNSSENGNRLPAAVRVSLEVEAQDQDAQTAGPSLVRVVGLTMAGSGQGGVWAGGRP
jgi:prepilin-type N-terminal cleavage/methylation domain-containing protein